MKRRGLLFVVTLILHFPEKILTHYSGRVKTTEAVAALKTGLANPDWQDVYVEDTDAFLDTFLTLYDRDCPVQMFTQNKMKTAKVILIYKNVSNYDVSFLPQFSKLLEKLFVQRLDSFIEKYDLLNDHQYGF